MINSLRRISVSLLLVGVLGFGLSTVATIPLTCDSFSSCLSAVPVYEADFTIAVSTKNSNLNFVGISFADMVGIVQAISTFMLLLAVLALITLELFELHYLRLIFNLRHH